MSRRRYTDDDVLAAVAVSTTYAGVLRLLGLVPAGGNYELLKRRIAELQANVDHFTRQGWSRGRTFPAARKGIDHLLVEDRLSSSHRLRKGLLASGMKTHRCESCGLEQWRSEPIPLELDHINGKKNDNRLDNVRLLCPNCHAQTPTYRGKNIARPKQ